MKALFYLVALIGIGLAISYFGFGMHPQQVWNRILSSTGTTQNANDVSSSANRLRAVAGERFGEAQDVYHGKTERDDPYAYPTAR